MNWFRCEGTLPLRCETVLEEAALVGGEGASSWLAPKDISSSLLKELAATICERRAIDFVLRIYTILYERIISLKTTKNVWDYLKKEYVGDEKIRGMQVLNLIREFELQKMKESKTIKEYSDRLLWIVNKVRLLDTNFTDLRIVEKILVIVLKRYKASITTLEDTKDLSKITLAKLLNALQAQEQQRLIRQDHITEGALPAKH